MGKQAFKYVPLCMGIYLVLSAIEFFLFKPLINMITVRFIYHVIIYNVFLLIVNPIATKLLVDKFFNFKSNDIGKKDGSLKCYCKGGQVEKD